MCLSRALSRAGGPITGGEPPEVEIRFKEGRADHVVWSRVPPFTRR